MKREDRLFPGQKRLSLTISSLLRMITTLTGLYFPRLLYSGIFVMICSCSGTNLSRSSHDKILRDRIADEISYLALARLAIALRHLLATAPLVIARIEARPRISLIDILRIGAGVHRLRQPLSNASAHLLLEEGATLETVRCNSLFGNGTA
jgi:hypothetical protein